MPRKKKYLYGYYIEFPDGDFIENDPHEGEGPWQTEDEAIDAALEALSNWRLGAEMFHMSNPGDYPDPDEDEEPEISLIRYDAEDFE